MKGGTILGLAALGTAVAVLVTKSKSSPRPAPECKTWWWPCETPSPSMCNGQNPIASKVTLRAKELRALDELHRWPLGTTFDEWIDGRLYRFRIEMHGANAMNPIPHRGVGVKVCMDSGIEPTVTGVRATLGPKG